jgi:D-glycero-D-manno-heptose 1,7-bisphosphate phosphatase
MSSEMRTRPHRALFLDRDGVINVNHGYVYRPQDVEFIDGIFALCLAAQKLGYRIIVITNQSGIARRYYSQADFAHLRRWLEHQFWRHGIRITHTYHCPHHPDMNGAFGHACCCRKPRPGMIVRAARQFDIDLSRSLLVGDSESDIECAHLAGVGRAVHLMARDRHPGPPLLHSRRKGVWLSRALSAIIPLLNPN